MDDIDPIYQAFVECWDENPDELLQRVQAILLARPEAVFVSDERSETPLHYATIVKNYEVAHLLLIHHANVNAQNIEGRTPLHKLLSGGTKTVSQRVALGKLLVQYGAAINQPDAGGSTPLGMATTLSHPLDVAMLKFLFEHGAKVNTPQSDGSTLLHVVNSVEAAEILLSHGAKMEARDPEGRTSLLFHLYRGSGTNIIEWLCSQGADISARDNSGRSALHYAVMDFQNDYVRVLKMLLQKGADFQVPDNQGWTPLHQASCGHFLDGIRILLSVGADVLARTQDGKTALDLVQEGCYAGKAPDYVPPPRGSGDPRAFKRRQQATARILKQAIQS